MATHSARSRGDIGLMLLEFCEIMTPTLKCRTPGLVRWRGSEIGNRVGWEPAERCALPAIP
jgi:hypothetical protein